MAWSPCCQTEDPTPPTRRRPPPREQECRTFSARWRPERERRWPGDSCSSGSAGRSGRGSRRSQNDSTPAARITWSTTPNTSELWSAASTLCRTLVADCRPCTSPAPPQPLTVPMTSVRPGLPGRDLLRHPRRQAPSVDQKIRGWRLGQVERCVSPLCDDGSASESSTRTAQLTTLSTTSCATSNFIGAENWHPAASRSSVPFPIARGWSGRALSVAHEHAVLAEEQL